VNEIKGAILPDPRMWARALHFAHQGETREEFQMRKSQISVVRESDWGPVQSSVRWNGAFAGLCVALLTFVALAALTMGLTTGTMNDALLSPVVSPEVHPATKWLLTLLFICGAIALFTGAFVSARTSGPITARVGRTEGLVISTLFFAFLFAAGYLSGQASPHFRAISSSIDVEEISAARSPEMQSLIGPRLIGLTLDRPVESVTEGIMKRMLVNPDSAYNYLAKRAGIPPQTAQRRLAPIRAQILPTYTMASIRARRVARSIGFLVSGAILLGSLSAMAGGTLGALWNLRTPLSRFDREALNESAAA
jgi:hypothetical protein